MDNFYYAGSLLSSLYSNSPSVNTLIKGVSDRVYGKKTCVFTHIRPEPFTLICCLALFALAPKGSKPRETFIASLIADTTPTERNYRNDNTRSDGEKFPDASCDLILVWQRIIEIALITFPPLPKPQAQIINNNTQMQTEVKNQPLQQEVAEGQAQTGINNQQPKEEITEIKPEVKIQVAQQEFTEVKAEIKQNSITSPEYSEAIRTIYEFSIKGLNVMISTYDANGDKAATIKLLKQCITVIKSALNGTMPVGPSGGPVDQKITNLSLEIWQTPSDIETIARYILQADDILKQNPKNDVKDQEKTILGLIQLHSKQFTPHISEELNFSLSFGSDV